MTKRQLTPLSPATDARRAILDVSADELNAWLREHGQPPMRAKQIRRWILASRAESFDAMTDLPLGLRQGLARHFQILGMTIAHHSRSDDSTHKLLLRLTDGNSIECVLIQEDDRHTACISTQVGCGMGCVFCASGLDGVARNLTSGEIIEQLVRLRNLLAPEERLTHIVVMGMGEPLANLDNLLVALAAAGERDGLGIGARHVTISTVGLPPRILQLAQEGKQYHLAVSLHAPTDALRTKIVPTNDKTGLEAIMAAADEFFTATGRQVTYEYVLLRGINDNVQCARQLAALLRGRHAHVNLIPFNDVEGLPYRPPTAEALAAFSQELRSAGISIKVRKRKGSAIDAACGQLRRQIGPAPTPAGSEPDSHSRV
jgi:23S rRNA (adenine2503-C2)-methyltransferase